MRLEFGAKPRLTYNNHRNSEADFAVEWNRRKRGAGLFFYPVPRFRRRNGTAKIQMVQGFKGGDFLRSLQKILPVPCTI